MVNHYRDNGRPRHRVVVTGMGALTPIGNSLDAYWEALLAGRSGGAAITRFDTTNFTTRIACEVKDFDPTSVAERKEARRMDRSQLYALGAANEAIAHSKVDFDAIDRDRCGVVIGSGIGGIDTFEKQHETLLNQGPGRVSPFFIPMMIVDMSAGMVSLRYGLKGPNYATVSACASAGHAIADSARLIERGDADLMITGGAEATITPASLAGFCSARAISQRNDDPERASRPFDVNRDGFVMGEGAGILVLESLEHALKRGATIYGEILGSGMSADAYHITAPAPQGEGAARAMKAALKDAGLVPEQIDYINTHGTSTGLGDIAETDAIKSVFGEHAQSLIANSTKSMIGHLLGAAAAVELIATIQSLLTGKIHPTINLDDQDPKCDLNYAANTVVERPIRYAISNSFGFGGHNSTLVAARYEGE
ncbi:MAG: beta-ketoacyl-ACP synthase II [Candidatus Zixiibacteriota bacterium]